jgi:hypothetical protein
LQQINFQSFAIYLRKGIGWAAQLTKIQDLA